MADAPICPYCDQPSKLVTGADIYPHRRDLRKLKFWHCKPCKAWVGCHRPNRKFGYDGTQPLGRLANAELRKAKSAAHAAFDPLWRGKMQRDGKGQVEARNAGYAWLSEQLGVGVDDCHIGMFDVETCERVVAVCTPPFPTPSQEAG